MAGACGIYCKVSKWLKKLSVQGLQEDRGRIMSKQGNAIANDIVNHLLGLVKPMAKSKIAQSVRQANACIVGGRHEQI